MYHSQTTCIQERRLKSSVVPGCVLKVSNIRFSQQYTSIKINVVCFSWHPLATSRECQVMHLQAVPPWWSDVLYDDDRTRTFKNKQWIHATLSSINDNILSLHVMLVPAANDLLDDFINNVCILIGMNWIFRPDNHWYSVGGTRSLTLHLPPFSDLWRH